MKEKLILESTPFASSSLAPVHVHVHIVVIVIIVVVVVVIVRVADIYVADICEASPNKCEKKRLQQKKFEKVPKHKSLHIREALKKLLFFRNISLLGWGGRARYP